MPSVKEEADDAAYRRSLLVNDSDQTDQTDEENNYYDLNKNLYKDKSVCQIQIRTPEQDSLPRFPKEKQKALVAFGLMTFSFVVNSISIALTHDRVPDRDHVPPLPDFFLDNLIEIPQLMRLPDVFVLITIFACLVTILLHKHRWILARRAFFVMSILYFMRSVTMYVTVLPVANSTVYCAPKTNSTTALQIAKRVSDLLIGGGMQISGKKNSCGDYIYSGHTALLVHGYLFLKEYSPKKFYIIHWISWGISWAGMGVILLARGHYTIDVLIGYYAATRMFWTYHSFANNLNLRVKSEFNYHSNVWWFPVFQYLEGNVKAPLPKYKHYSPPSCLVYSTVVRNSGVQGYFNNPKS